MKSRWLGTAVAAAMWAFALAVYSRLPNRIPANAIPEAKLPEECAATGRSPMRCKLLAIQFKPPSNLNEPEGVQP